MRQHLRLVNLDLIEKGIGLKQRVGDFPFLLEQLDIAGEFGRRVERRYADAALQVDQAQLFPLLLFECRGRKTRKHELGPVHVHREVAADLELGHGSNRLGQTSVGNAVAFRCNPLG